MRPKIQELLNGLLIRNNNRIGYDEWLDLQHVVKGTEYNNLDFSGVSFALGYQPDFFRHNFESCNFSGAYLRTVNFSCANLRYVNFCNANLIDADFYGADLTGADFTGATIRLGNRYVILA